eukprot:scaffold161275_cov30-Tisochrysis_lutea.AAC.2
MEGGNTFAKGDQSHARGLDSRIDSAASSHTHIGPWTPLDRRGCDTAYPPAGSKGIETAVRSSIVGLATAPEHRSDGREKNAHV